MLMLNFEKLKQITQSTSPSRRLLPVDALRGMIIVVMALDHANTFISNGKLGPEMWTGLFPNYAGHPPITFLTRFFTHLAAPGFFLLMGVGMAMLADSRRQRGWSGARTDRFFLLRGGLLILLQFLVENRAWDFGSQPVIYFGVLYGLGASMIFAILLLKLPKGWLLLISGLLILSTIFTLPAAQMGFSSYPFWTRLLFLPGTTGMVVVYYPLIPWLGVVGLGIVYGRWLREDRKSAYRGAFWIGIGALLLFVILRLIGGIGNIRPPIGEDWTAYLNVVKYPPSVAFLSLTLGVNMFLVALFSRFPEKILWPLAVFGLVPLFFYLTHLFLYKFAGGWLDPGAVDIPRMYPYWLLGLVILWPLCLLYGQFKGGRSPDSIWRLF